MKKIDRFLPPCRGDGGLRTRPGPGGGAYRHNFGIKISGGLSGVITLSVPVVQFSSQDYMMLSVPRGYLLYDFFVSRNRISAAVLYSSTCVREKDKFVLII